MHSIAAEALAKSANWDAQAISNTAWSCAAIAMRHAPLCQSLSAAAIPRIYEFKSQECSNPAWAFATMEFRDWPLLDAIASGSIALMADFDAQGMSNPAWAFSVRCSQHVPLMEAISAESRRLYDHANTQELANFAWSNWALMIRDFTLLRPAVEIFPSTLDVNISRATLGRLVGVEWVHVADCAADESGYTFFNLALLLVKSCDLASQQQCPHTCLVSSVQVKRES